MSDNKVVVPDKVLDSLEAVRDSGITNMAHFSRVKELVSEETATWLDENKESYMQGFFYGFKRESEQHDGE